MYISNLEIHNFRNFKDAKVKLKDGVNVVLGPNNAGKTNLLKAINLLSNRENLKVSDFNYNNLSDNFKDFFNEAPKIEIIYTIEHVFNCDGIDSAIVKLKNFIVYDDDGNLEQQSDGNYKIIGKFKLSYGLNEKFLEEYKKDIQNIKDLDEGKHFNEFIEILEKYIEYYSWICYNANDDPINNFSEISNIFSIDFIPADRKTDTLLPETRKFVKQRIKEDELSQGNIKTDVSKLLNERLQHIKINIQEEFKEDQEHIGITNGHNILETDFKYEGDAADCFQFILKDEDRQYNLPLENNGLGYNNLIQIYNIIKFNIHDDYNIILMEEPESHLHPAMQYKLFKYLQSLEESKGNKIKNQIVITTHSPNISASSNIDDIISVHYFRDSTYGVLIENIKEKFISDDASKNQKLQQSKEHLMKFLDVTRSDMLFTEKTILVEGLAEKMLMPLFSIHEEMDLIDNHISLVEVGGINFKHFLPLFNNGKNKVLCIRDCDFSYKDNNDNLNINKKEYEKHISELSIIDEDYKDNVNIRGITQMNGGSTFEDELYLENICEDDKDESKDSNCKNLLKLVLPESIIKSRLIKKLDFLFWFEHKDEIANEKTRNKIINKLEIYKKIYDSSDDNKKYIEDLFFAKLFLSYAFNQKGNLALSILVSPFADTLKTPKYIKEGLKWIK